MKAKSDQELTKLLTDTRAQLRTERFAAAASRAKDSTTMKKQRAVVARILTEQSSRARAVEGASTAVANPL